VLNSEGEGRGPEAVRQALTAAGVVVSFIPLQQSGRTAPLAAQALRVPLGSIVKSLLFLADGQAILLLVAGDRRVATDRLKGLLGVRRVKIADARRVEEETGFPVGGVPPVGHRHPLPTWVDRSLERFETVYAAAGHPDILFAISFSELVRVTGGQVADFTNP